MKAGKAVRSKFKNIFFAFIGIFIIILMSAIPVNANIFNDKFTNPYGVAVDKGGHIYVLDSGNDMVKKYDMAANGYQLLYSFGVNGTGNGQFRQPQGIAVDWQGNIYITDTGNNRIQKLHDDGTTISFVKTILDGQLYYPRDIDLTPDGTCLYILDSGRDRIIKTDLEGSNIPFTCSNTNILGSSGSSLGEFHEPYGMGIDDDGNIYVSDKRNQRIQVFFPTGDFLRQIGGVEGVEEGKFLDPQDVAVDSIERGKRIYIADTMNSRIQIFDNNGNFL